jgi:hypothetical protein
MIKMDPRSQNTTPEEEKCDSDQNEEANLEDENQNEMTVLQFDDKVNNLEEKL